MPHLRGFSARHRRPALEADSVHPFLRSSPATSPRDSRYASGASDRPVHARRLRPAGSSDWLAKVPPEVNGSTDTRFRSE